MNGKIAAGALIALAAGSVLAARPVIVESPGNNLSTPVLFSEGIGVTGADVTVSTGLRGAPGVVTLGGAFVTLDGVNWYEQQDLYNEWQAEWRDGRGAVVDVTEVDWSDNLESNTWNLRSVVRVEVAMSKALATPASAYNMKFLYGEGLDEMWGTDGSTFGSASALVYSACARLTMQKLDGDPALLAWDPAVHAWTGTDAPILYNSAVWQRYGVDGQTNAYSAEISVSGRLIYGYNWLVSRLNAGAGWYRLTFSLDADCPFPLNTSLATAVKGPQPALLTYDPVILPASNLTWIDVYIAQR